MGEAGVPARDSPYPGGGSGGGLGRPSGPAESSARAGLAAPRTPESTDVYAAIRLYSSFFITFYRRSVEGRELPSSGPLLVVANHSGGLVDPGLLIAHTRRKLRFLAKYKLFEMPAIGTLARSVGAIPIYRKQDNVDTALNQGAFERVHDTLAAGEVIAIFPEGTSAGTPPRHAPLRKLKTGAARMALGAEAAAEFQLGLRIVPIALVYEARDKLRSVVHIRIGAPLSIAHLKAQHADDAWATAEALTETIAAAQRDTMTAAAQARVEAQAEPGPLAGARWALRAITTVVFALPAFAAFGIGRLVRPTPDKFVTTVLLITSGLSVLWVAAVSIGAFLFLPQSVAVITVIVMAVLIATFPWAWSTVNLDNP